MAVGAPLYACSFVNLRLMRNVGLQAECGAASVIVGPVQAAHYGEFSPVGERNAIDIGTVADATGKERVAPVSDYWDQIPRGSALIHGAQPDSGKTYAALVHAIETMERNMTERRLYVLVSPTVSLATSHQKEFNTLFRMRASARLKEAVRFMYDSDNADYDDSLGGPCLFYKDASRFHMSHGGIVSTTIHSLHKYGGLFDNSDAPIGFCLLDEFEKLVPTSMDPKLAASSSVLTNVATLFNLLKTASARGAPIHIVDGLPTRELTEHVVMASNIPYVIIKCSALRNYTGKRIAEVHDFVTANPGKLGNNDAARANGTDPKVASLMTDLHVTRSAGGIVRRIIDDIKAGERVQLYVSCKEALYVIFEVIKDRLGPDFKRSLYVLTGDTVLSDRQEAIAHASDTSRAATFACIATTQSVGGGLNFNNVTVCYGLPNCKVSTAGDDVQVMVRGRYLTRGIYMCRDFSFEPVSDALRWTVYAEGEVESIHVPLPGDEVRRRRTS